jgi:hypothetical protein
MLDVGNVGMGRHASQVALIGYKITDDSEAVPVSVSAAEDGAGAVAERDRIATLMRAIVVRGTRHNEQHSVAWHFGVFVAHIAPNQLHTWLPDRMDTQTQHAMC